MTEITILNTLKQSFEKVAPKHDGHAKSPHLEFLSGLIFFFLGNTKSLSLESMRRDLMSTFVIYLSKGAFWERLAGHRLKKMFYDLLENLMQKLPAQALIGSEILDKLSVSRIRLVDTSIISLWDGASGSYPGTFMNAGIKWHLCFDLFAGKMDGFKTTAASVHDRNGFPDIKSLANQLIVFDLGDWDYGLLIDIAVAKNFFLSRVKSDATFMIKSVVTGLSKSYVDPCFSAVKLKERS